MLSYYIGQTCIRNIIEIHGIEPTIGKLPSLIVPMPAETVEEIDLWIEHRKRRRK